MRAGRVPLATLQYGQGGGRIRLAFSLGGWLILQIGEKLGRSDRDPGKLGERDALRRALKMAT